MIGLAEYVAATAELRRFGQKLEAEMTKGLFDELTKDAAIKFASRYIPMYQAESRRILHSTWLDIANQAVEHYSGQLNIAANKELAERIVAQQYAEHYYGATLNARMIINEKRMQRRLIQTVQVDPKKINTLFTQPIPFGSQLALDQRVLLSTASKIENDVARALADENEIPFLRWRTSHQHSKEDICDELANNIDRKVVAYLKEKQLDIDPKGLYFASDLPLPPHPNCQCEYGMVTDKGPVRSSGVKRAISKIRTILRKLRGK